MKIHTYRCNIKVADLAVEIMVKATSIIEAATVATSKIAECKDAEPHLTSVHQTDYCE